MRDLESELQVIGEKIASLSRYHKLELEEIFEMIRQNLNNRDIYDDNLVPIEF